MEEAIYKFGKVRSFLSSMGIRIGEANTYKKIKPGDVTIENGKLKGNVHVDSNDMFVITDSSGVNRNVYLIKKSFYFEWEGEQRKPKAHLCMCDVINTFGKKDYRYANDQSVTVHDKASDKDRKVKDLELCSHCVEKLKEKHLSINTIDEFIEKIKKSTGDSETKEVDIDFAGYVKDWPQISQTYREKKQYRCEKCGIDLSDWNGKFYCQVHHKNGNKLKNDDSNLQCLCVQCHSQVDERHRKNFQSKAQQKILESFLKLYGEKLEAKKMTAASLGSDNEGTTPQSVLRDSEVHEWVDLGLSVKWATCNIGASKPTECGDYFAWGETETKKDYTQKNYSLSKEEGDKVAITKYCLKSEYGAVDQKKELEESNDVATAKWGAGWRMPTLEEVKELVDGCKWEWQTDYQGTGIAGRVGTSIKNGKTIFFPAAGYIKDAKKSDVGRYGLCWTSTLSEGNSKYAYNLCCNNLKVELSKDFRFTGRSVRAIKT